MKDLKNKLIRAVCLGVCGPLRWVLHQTTGLHGIISKTTELFIATAVRPQIQYIVTIYRLQTVLL
jgi:hypothetical protein